MIQPTIRKALALALFAGIGAVAQAQEGNTTFFGGYHVVAGGAGPIFGSYDPSVQDATSRMWNDGTNGGDASNSDSLWTWAGVNATPSGVPTEVAEWKVASWDGVNAGTAWEAGKDRPNGGNAVYPTDAANVTFHFLDSSGSIGDGWLPDNNWVYTVPNNFAARANAASTFNIWGSFGSELGAPGNWGDTGTGALNLTRDPVNEEWTITLSGWQSIGNKAFKAIMNGSWGPATEVSANGASGGNNIEFFLLNTSDSVTLRIRESDGRYRFDGLTPLPTTDGIYALGPWTVAPETDSVMAVQADGYEITATVPTAGTHTLTIFEISGGSLTRLWPSQGSHPFKTTTPNQDVRVNLHMTAMGDGAFPDSEFIYTDPDSRLDFTSAANGNLQWVGMLTMWGTQYDASGTNDFLVPATDLVGSNDPIGTQVVGDPFLFRWDAPTTNHGEPLGFNKTYKVVGETDDLPSASGFDIQLGGRNDNPGSERRAAGVTLLGDNTNPLDFNFADATNYTFWVDSATGRVKVQLTTDPVPTLRPARANDATAVADWFAY